MRLKNGVNPFGIRSELLLALIVADGVWQAIHGLELVVTSLNDGEHSQTSLHYDAKAADLRTWEDAAGKQWSHGKKQTAVSELSAALGNNPDYDIVIEGDHIHLEYQPKRRTA